MKKAEVIVFSIFGFLLALTRFIEGFNYHNFVSIGAELDWVQKDNRALADQLYQQMKILSQYNNIVAIVIRVLSILFLLYIGWKIAYGFLGLRYIIPVTLCILIIPALIEFAFLPRDRTVWLLLCQDIFNAAIWIAIFKLYYLAWKKTMGTQTSELKLQVDVRKSEIIVFSIFGFLLALTSLVQNYFVAQHNALAAPYGGGASIPEEVFNQMQVVRQYQTVPYYAFRTVSVIFLLYIGWKIAYGLIGLRYIVPISLVILFIPQMIKFAFQPSAWSVWSFVFPNIIFEVIWIGIIIIYYLAWRKTMQRKLRTKITRI